jgi:uncharacterized protein DUF4168
MQRRNHLITKRTSILSHWPGISWALTAAPDGDGGASASPYGENDLNSFAVAAVKVYRINNEYTLKMEETQADPQVQEQLEERATDEMVQAVKSEGLSVDTYQTIATRIKSDPALAAKVQQKIESVALEPAVRARSRENKQPGPEHSRSE